MTDTALPEILGQRTRALRAARGLTRKALAGEAGLSLRFVAEIEAGRANPSLGSLEALARALEVHPFSLLSAHGSAAHDRLYASVAGMGEDEAQACASRLFGAVIDALRPVALVGLRGAGKSTVGAKLAKRTGRPFVELDQWIEREAGMELGALFELHGEQHYRALERRILDEVLRDPRRPVVALSGGAIADEGAQKLLASKATTVWLKARPQEHWDRVIAQGDRRPMHGRARARAELEELFARRAPLYAQSDLVIETTGKTADAVVAELAQRIERPSPAA